MPPARHVHLPNASASWKLIMQSGAGLSVTVGLTLSSFIAAELKLTERDQLVIEALVLDGMPVDDPAAAVINNGSRLALAAGLPGIAGLAMKKNSAVRGLRGAITHKGSGEVKPGAGRVTLFLYSLTLPALGGHFLKKGIFVTPAQFKRYARFAPENICRLGSRHLTVSDFTKELSLDETPDELFLTAIITESLHD